MFNEKLRELMEQKNISTNQLAERLYSYGEHTDPDLWENYDGKKSYVRKVNKWKSGTSKPGDIDTLGQICDVLDCDSDYLLGRSQIKNVNNAVVADYLGLDEITISRIKGYSNREKAFMSLLVRADEHENRFGDILREILDILLLHSDNSSNKTIQITDDLTGDVEKLEGESATAYVTSAVKTMMEPIFYKVSILGIHIGEKARDIQRKKDKEKHDEEIEHILNNIQKLTGQTREEVLKDFEEFRKQKKKED